MKISTETFNQRLDQFVMQVVVPAAKSAKTLARIGFAKMVGLLKLSEEQAAQLTKAGVMDEAGDIDLDLFRKGVTGAVDLAGKYPVEDLDIALNRAEVEKFLHVLETGRLD